MVYEELLHVKALAHLSTMVKRELAMIIGFQQHRHAGEFFDNNFRRRLFVAVFALLSL